MQDSESPTECCSDLKAKLDDWKACAERSVRDEPLKTAGLAFVAGIFLTILPVGRILSGLVQVAFALVMYSTGMLVCWGQARDAGG